MLFIPSALTILNTLSSGKVLLILQNLAQCVLSEAPVTSRCHSVGDTEGGWERGKGRGQSGRTLDAPPSTPALTLGEEISW